MEVEQVGSHKAKRRINRPNHKMTEAKTLIIYESTIGIEIITIYHECEDEREGGIEKSVRPEDHPSASPGLLYQCDNV